VGILGLEQRGDLRAVGLVVLPADGVAGRLAGGVLQRQPGVEDARELDQAEQEQEQEREDQRELEQRLPPAFLSAPSLR